MDIGRPERNILPRTFGADGKSVERSLEHEVRAAFDNLVELGRELLSNCQVGNTGDLLQPLNSLVGNRLRVLIAAGVKPS